jgi:hypothetical protein
MVVQSGIQRMSLMCSALCLHLVRIPSLIQRAATITEGGLIDVALLPGFIGEACFTNGNNDKWYG